MRQHHGLSTDYCLLTKPESAKPVSGEFLADLGITEVHLRVRSHELLQHVLLV